MQQRIKPALVAALLAFALLAMLTGAMNLRSYRLERDMIASLLSGHDLKLEERARATLPVQMARALFLSRHERIDEARDLLNYLSERGDSASRTSVFYNLGNLLLRQALARLEADEIDQAIPLIALSKDAYRRALELDPGHWDSKYNLEVAMRISPEIERVDNNQKDDQEEGNPKKLWTTLPGFPRGQP
ncbi:MxaK protein [Candidatus Methylospira mobilis]|uniref:MxaK protein n=1 Tax=Candidatus Methylospira mobilis TaxID=1808979 RepID=A0A5Q0BHK3_9GAMM|nr:MxaK protein [Candidatus Methylospira mobilis]QFY42602.1 MxaK protein [Candidatus Methylospira mobilis]WNV04282.1 MxaK protein [Candidatus Methylospira mobilis]